MILEPVMTFKQIGDEMGLTPERIGQIYAGAIKKMQKNPDALAMLAMIGRKKGKA